MIEKNYVQTIDGAIQEVVMIKHVNKRWQTA